MRTIAIDDDLKKHLDKIMNDRSHNRPELIALKEAVYKQHPDWYSRYQTLGELNLYPGDKVYFHTGSSKIEGVVVVHDGELCVYHGSSLNGTMSCTPIKNSVTPAWSIAFRINDQSIEKQLAHALNYYTKLYPWKLPQEDEGEADTAIQNLLHGNGYPDGGYVDFLPTGLLHLMKEALEQLQALEHENTEREKAWSESEETIQNLRDEIKEKDSEISSLSWQLSETL